MAASGNKARGDDVKSSAKMSDNTGSDRDQVRKVEFSGKKTKNSEMISLEIDLTNPADLMKKLELVDLTEEEADDLFQQAMEVNKLLKAELKRQNKKAAKASAGGSSAAGSAGGPPGLGPRQSTQLHLSAPASAASRSSGKSVKSSVSINQVKPLPPIRNPSATSQASLKSSAGQTRQGGKSKTHGAAYGGKYSYISSPQAAYGPKPPGSSSSGSKGSTPLSSASNSRKEQVVWQKTSKSAK